MSTWRLEANSSDRFGANFDGFRNGKLEAAFALEHHSIPFKSEHAVGR